MREWSTPRAILLGVLAILAVAGMALAQRGAWQTAWQRDEQLGQKWKEITGRFIFQQACLGCHDQAQHQFTKAQWEEKMAGFPDEAHPPLPDSFNDLTAMFSTGQMVPSETSRHDAVKAFLVSTAPAKETTSTEASEPANLLPRVGEPAPDFSITLIDDEEFKLSSLKGKKNLVLVFSRAHW